MGRSCILVSIAGKNVMLDCGMHMGFSDDVSLKGGRPGIQPAPRRHHRGTWASESQALTMEEERGQVGTGRRAAPTVTQQVEHLVRLYWSQGTAVGSQLSGTGSAA